MTPKSHLLQGKVDIITSRYKRRKVRHSKDVLEENVSVAEFPSLSITSDVSTQTEFTNINCDNTNVLFCIFKSNCDAEVQTRDPINTRYACPP